VNQTSPKMFLAKDVSLIVYDFDGVMTNNKVILSEDGLESVVVNRSDGLAIEIFKNHNIPQMIMSKERNKIVSVRAKKLGIPVLQSVDDKKAAIEGYCKEKNIDLKNVIYVGNDLNDLIVMQAVGHPIAPLDACQEVRDLAELVIPVEGGNGVVRELLNLFDLERR
jgi:3-deoxy-D-manno-octulosonate 8-phosphate phosphatase (KDO 8-P phosphatase)